MLSRIFLGTLLIATALSASARARTYANPMNLDYAYCPLPQYAPEKHRTAADPAMTAFRGDYYLFPTNQSGYWWSHDMSRWTFVPQSFVNVPSPGHDDICAPATVELDGALFVTGKNAGEPLWRSTAPKEGLWTKFVTSYDAGDDPAFFADDDGRVYLYSGSSNTDPLYGQELDRKTFRPIGEKKALLALDGGRHGWQRFGEGNDDTFLKPFIEGAWMTKHQSRYYLQYGAPGTEFSGYADGVAVATAPLGPFTDQAHNPFSYKPGGYARGAGHGSTFSDRSGRWWHVSTIAVGVKNNFERRIGLWPAAFDSDGVLHADTAYGDFPHFLPDEDGRAGQFTGWMILNYNKPVKVSSTLGGHVANFAVDEDIKTYWSAETGNPGEWLETDLGAVSSVYAVQIDYADQDAELMGKQAGISEQYRLYDSRDGQSWHLLVDKSRSREDAPHDYVELDAPVRARFLRIENVRVPTGKFALSGFRAFGKGTGPAPQPIRDFVVLRGASERRNAWLKWRAGDDAVGYTVYAGVAPDKLYTSVTVYSANEYYFRAMDNDRTYYFSIEAFNENGIGPRSAVREAHSTPEINRFVAVIAHRGDHVDNPENSLPAVAAAVAAGADFVELDIRTTMDGELVLMHDEAVDRTTDGHGRVAAMTRAEVRALNAAAKSQPSRPGVKVPTFDEALSAAKGKIKIYMDVKDASAKTLLAKLETHGMKDDVVVYADDVVLKELSSLDAAVRIMPEAENESVLRANLKAWPLKVVAFENSDFNDGTISLAKAAKADVFVDCLWAQDTEADWQRAVDRGATGIQTNRPEDLLRYLRARHLHP